MPLALEEIQPGIVAILETKPLVEDSAVEFHEDKKEFRTGPFLCVQVKDGRSLWLEITKQKDKRGLRLLLEKEWKVDGSDMWRGIDSYISDARHPIIGPSATFVVAGSKELPHQPHNRPKISQQGIDRVIGELNRYRSPLL